MTWRGDDIGHRLTRQPRDFHRLNPEQQKQLAQLGIEAATTPARRPAPSGTKTGTAAAGAGRGAEALRNPLLGYQDERHYHRGRAVRPGLEGAGGVPQHHVDGEQA
ncbi:hypothetical protein [Streptomyces sp. NPDC051994]|uniref:hypothetical protein n=1 Tax=unclassified Streptomyces TaxID=2593676 RepID=UPI00343D4B61